MKHLYLALAACCPMLAMDKPGGHASQVSPEERQAIADALLRVCDPKEKQMVEAGLKDMDNATLPKELVDKAEAYILGRSDEAEKRRSQCPACALDKVRGASKFKQ